MSYGLSGNWRIECSIDIDQHSSLAIAADPILLTAVAVMGQPELDVFAALGDVIDQARFRRTIAKGFQAVRDRSGLDKKVVPYLARHTYGTYTMAKTKNTFAVADSMGHVDLKSMEPYQHQELEPLRAAINERNQARKERKAHVVGSGLGHIPGHTDQAAL
jgi:hypothetical protein